MGKRKCLIKFFELAIFLVYYTKYFNLARPASNQYVFETAKYIVMLNLE
jgi:hypothetical protein